MSGLHILVVEDCDEAAASLALFLRRLGHHVRVAADGPAAIAGAGADKPDVVLLDIALPGMSGDDVARHLREHLLDKPPLIIALTGCGRESDRRRSEESGIDLHLVKPADPRVLRNVLSRFASVVA
jgi:CheY-like chemotaxis protein